MKRLLAVIAMASTVTAATVFADDPGAGYDPSPAFPFGRQNPAAPAELDQFSFMIGNNNCTEQRRNASGGEWQTSARTWDARYYMNGMAIIDTGRSGTSANGNVRIYDSSSGEWVVTFFSMPSFGTGTWRGGLVGDQMVLQQPQKAPGSSIEGHSRLTFSNISDTGFNWEGRWISSDGAVEYPFWRIQCRKTEDRQ